MAVRLGNSVKKKADEKLFTKIQNNSNHVLFKFSPEKKTITYNLRKRKHNYVLPDKDDRNYINSMLFL